MHPPRVPEFCRQRPARFLFGVAYYPEHDLAGHLADDPERLLAAGVNVVRMGEFAWDRLEPRPGVFDFTLFDEHIARLGRVGIQTILCTPTATPPVWLVRGHPEVVHVDADGRAMQHGSRQHASLSSPRFREHSRRITAAMAAHFADHPHVIGWQTDNEIYCHCSEDHSEAAQAAFREFLGERYGDISALNAAWGTSFWAQSYAAFGEITTPRPMRPAAENPGHRLDYLRFLTHAATEFQRDQVRILRAANPRWWITHNGVFRNLDYREFARDLDFMSVDVYPLLAFMDAPGEASPAVFPARLLARTRSLTGRFVVTELQSGAGGQGDWMSVTPEPGQMRLFAWQAVAHGADGVLHFRWRTCRFGAEEYWEGVLDHDNVPRRRFDELCAEGAEFRRLAGVLRETAPRPDVGVLFDPGAAELGHRPITHGLPSPWDVADTVFTAWWRAGFDVGYVHPLDALADFRLLFLCSPAIVTDAVVSALEAWVESGGTLVCFARSGIKDERGQVRADSPPGALARLAGCAVEEHSRVHVPHLTGSPAVSLRWGDVVLPEQLWREILRPIGGEVVATWQEGRFAGLPAVVAHQRGAGRCVYVGTYASAAMMPTLIPRLAASAGVAPIIADPPPDVEVRRRTGGGRELTFLLNHSAAAKAVTGVPAGEELLEGGVVEGGGLELAPFGVAVIRSKDDRSPPGPRRA